jgi:hypothetical protein
METDMHPTVIWTLNLASIAVMLGAVIINHVMTHRRKGQADQLEAAKLRTALLSELRALQDIYRVNLDLIENKARYLISTRSPIMVYKSNLARLTILLERSAIEKLVSLFSRNEIIEQLVSVHSNGRGGMSYRLLPRYTLDELKQMYAAGIDHIADTCEELCKPEADARAAAAAPRFTSPILLPSFRQRQAEAEAS